MCLPYTTCMCPIWNNMLSYEYEIITIWICVNASAFTIQYLTVVDSSSETRSKSVLKTLCVSILIFIICINWYNKVMSEPANLTFRWKRPVFFDIHTQLCWHLERERKKGITASLLIQSAATWHFKQEVLWNEHKNTRESLNRSALLQLK